MPIKLSSILCTLSVVGLAACSQQEEPIIYSEPVYDKYGNAAPCDDGSTYQPGSVDLPPCEPEDEECTDDTAAIGAGALPCPPRDEGEDPSGGGRSPTGGARP